MNKFQLTRIGEFHTDHNEDNLLITEIGNEKTVIAVMDGCSMGTESFFASTLLKKIIQKTSKELHYKEFILRNIYSIEETLNLVLENIVKQLQLIKNELDLSINELLSTLILGIINSTNKEARIIVIGDGLISINGQIHEFDQDNKPDYIEVLSNSIAENLKNVNYVS